MSTPIPLAAAYGGGGLFGIAYLLGVGEALADGGVPLPEVPSVGTSAGTWAAGALELGVRWRDAIDLLAPKVPRLPNPRRGKLRALATEVFGERRATNLRAVVFALPRMRRVVLDGRDHPLADLVAASSAVPGLLASHKIAGRRYVDGGVRSFVSADLAPRAQHLLVIAPLAGPMFGPAGRVTERILRREMGEWQRNNPDGRLWLIRPNHAIAALAWQPGQLFNVDRAKRAYELAYRQGSGILTRWEEAYGGQQYAQQRRRNGAAKEVGR